MNLALTEHKMCSVRHMLTWLRTQAEPDACILCDSAGNVIDRVGDGPWESALVTALAAGVYGASRELARILGQVEFDSVLNQGEKTSTFFQSVTEDLLLVLVFSETASTGLVKLYAARAAELLRHTLADTQHEAQAREDYPTLTLKNEGDMFDINIKQPHPAKRQNQRETADQI